MQLRAAQPPRMGEIDKKGAPRNDRQRPAQRRALRCGCSAVTEVSDAGEGHGHAKPVGGRDDLGVADRATGLDDGSGSGPGDDLEAVREGEEGVRGSDGSGQRKDSLLGAEAGGVDPAHLAGADADGLAEGGGAGTQRAGVDDGV